LFSSVEGTVPSGEKANIFFASTASDPVVAPFAGVSLEIRMPVSRGKTESNRRD
jgi:hypothetical protein